MITTSDYDWHAFPNNAYSANDRLQSLLTFLESALPELERSTARFTKANDQLERSIKRGTSGA